MSSLLCILLAIVTLSALPAYGKTDGKIHGKTATDKMKADYFIKRLTTAPKYSMDKVDMIDSALKYSSDKKKLEELNSMKADALFDIGNYNLALPVYEKIYSGLEVDDTASMHILDNLGASYYFTGHYDRAIARAHELLEISKNDSLLYYDARAYHLIANVYIRLMNVEAAEKYLEEVKNILDKAYKISKHKRNIQMRRYWLTQSAIHILRKDYETAYQDLTKAQSTPSDELSDLLLDINMAIVYGQMGETAMAEEFYRRIEAFPFAHYNKILGLNNYSALLLYNGDYEGALRQTDKNLVEVKRLKFDHLRSQIYQIKSAIYVQLNDYKKAYLMLDSAKMVTDSLFSTQTIRNILLTNERYADGLSAREHSRRVAMGRKKVIAIFVLSALLLSAFVMLAIVWKRWKRTREQVMKAESENRRVCSELERMVEEANNERHKSSECVMALNKQREELQDVVIKLSAAGVAEKNLRQLRHMVEISESRDSQMHKLEMANKDFVIRLKEAHPDLTRGEIRMAIYIAMGKTSREIAEMINRSVRTVETVRYHLGRKVSEASGAQSLSSYLAQFNKTVEPDL